MAEKALASEADAVFLDLEDAVAPDEKPGARAKIVRAISELDWRGRPALYRANALDTPYFYRDVIEVVEEAGDGIDAVMVPKVNRPEDLHVVATLLSQLELAGGLDPGKIRIEGQIESAEGLINADAIARTTERLTALHFGPGDFAASLRMPQSSIGTIDEWDEVYPGHRVHYAMQRIVVAARAAGVRAVDGPVADYRDEEGLRKSSLLARSLGFDGKWCIHPAQIGVVNEVFSPTERSRMGEEGRRCLRGGESHGERRDHLRRTDDRRRLDQVGPEYFGSCMKTLLASRHDTRYGGSYTDPGY
jgi:citrate lyase beta subunit